MECILASRNVYCNHDAARERDVTERNQNFARMLGMVVRKVIAA
jgi:hypothetical protein